MIEQYSFSGSPRATVSVADVVRRLVDVVVCLVLLAVLLVPMLLIALAVRVEDRGPALFRQERVGLRRNRFTLLKFRTMIPGGDDRAHRDLIARELRGEDTVVNGSSKLDDDRRVTRVGAFLRRTSLDELPQLINVLRGDMTLVGPRPCLDWEADLFPAEFASRFDVSPGSPACGRSAAAARWAPWRCCELDVVYVRQPFPVVGPRHPAAHAALAAAQWCSMTGPATGTAMTTAFIATTGGHLTQLTEPRRAHPAGPGRGLGDPRERAEHVAARRAGRRVHPVRRRA